LIPGWEPSKTECPDAASLPRLPAYHNEAGIVHETRNPGTLPARAIATLIVDKGKPLFDRPPGARRTSIPMELQRARE
jgi:hypothetical protein